MDMYTAFGLIFGISMGAGIIGTGFKNWILDISGGLPVIIRLFFLEKLTEHPEVISFLHYYFYGFIFGGVIAGIFTKIL